jgi:bacteriocin biosynthesis cyclodehydratase domain-containing protein
VEGSLGASARRGILVRMVLQLNPRYPLVWRDPTSLQFGLDAPPVRLENVTNAQERIIAALVAGTSRPGLSLIAAAARSTEAELSELLELLQPVLGRPASAPSGTVAIIGTTPTAARLRPAIASLGLTVVAPDAPADLGILVCHYVVEPQLFGYWLSRDIAHLPIVYSDTGVTVGPVIEPGAGPCLYCLERHHTDADPAWPAMASQLWGRTSPAEDAVLASEVVAITLRLVKARLQGPPAPVATSVFVDAATGSVIRRRRERHPECGCAVLPENGSAPGLLPDPVQTPTTTGAAAYAHA